jgi:hypothetical protein
VIMSRRDGKYQTSSSCTLLCSPSSDVSRIPDAC